MSSANVFVRKLLLPVACWVAVSNSSASIGFEPACPATDDQIVIAANGPTVERDPLSLELKGTTIKLVGQAFNSGWTLPPETRVVGTLAPIPAGTYRIEFYTRVQPDGRSGGTRETLLPERFEGSRDLVVYETPPTCAAAHIESFGSTFATTTIGAPFPIALRWLVTDAHGNAVANHPLSIYRTNAPLAQAPYPDLAPGTRSIVTGPDGVATFEVVANGVPGTFQYTAGVSRIIEPSLAYVTLHNQPGASLLPDYPVVEFVRYTLNGPHFFLTGNSDEMLKLDNAPDWQRTGAVFMTFRPGTRRANTTPVCRFYGLPEVGLDSHFFSAAPEECDAVSQRFSSAWQLETSNAFEVFLPDRETGACPESTRKLHRAFNNRADANHRYALTQETALLNGYPEGGPRWSLEGYGLEAVVMCLPQ